MDAFSYLSVLYSIILGLAITQVLQGYRALLLGRANVRLYAPTLLWSAILLLIAVQSWWASFGLSSHQGWTFLGLFALLLQTGFLYMMSAIVLPDVARDERTDLRAHYWREATPFFALLLAMLAASLGKDVIIDGRLPGALNLTFHGVFAAAATLALAVRRTAIHLGVAVAIGALAVAYIATLFANL